MKHEIPYEQLQVIGLSKEVVDTLPEDFMRKLREGELTPIIQLRKISEDGTREAEMPVKLRLSGNNGELEVYPLNSQLRNTINVSPESFRRLEEGEVLNIRGEYIQRDPETNCIMKVKEKDAQYEQRLADLEKISDIELGLKQKEQIREGKPVELSVGGQPVVIGVDLRERDHFRELAGNMKDWDYQKKIEYDIAHPEYVGLVQTDKNRWEYQQIVMSQSNEREMKVHQSQDERKSNGMKL